MRRSLSRIVLGALFILAGVNHYIRPQMYRSIMPDYLPWHGSLVALSGIAEIGLGVLVLFRRWRGVARWGLIGLLIAVFPANVHMVMYTERYDPIPTWLLWLRLPLQAVLIGWVWFAANDHRPPTEHRPPEKTKW
jgi:uncharacterized membrane protein